MDRTIQVNSQHQTVPLSQFIQSSPAKSGFYTSTIRPLGSSKITPNQQFQEFVDEDEQKEIQSDRRWINLCILILPFILAVLFFFAGLGLVNASHASKLKLDGADNVLDFVHHNLQADPISSIISTYGECPNNYDDIRLGKWQGIDSGCLCKNGNTYRQESYEQCLPYLNKGCLYETGENSKKFYKWTDKDLTFCARYTPSPQWVQTANCDLSKNTYCGSSVCIIGKNASCPPNILKIDQLSNPGKKISETLGNLGNSKITTQSNFLIKPYDEKKSFPAIEGDLYYQQGVDPIENTAITGFAITQGQKLCLNKEFAQTNNNIYNLDVQQTQNRVCDEYGALDDDQVIVIDTAFQSQIFESNGYASIYTSQNLVHYNPQDYAANTYTLLAVKKIPVAKKAACDAVYQDYMEDAADLSSTTRTVLRVFAWILFAFSIITVILGVIFLLSAINQLMAKQQSTKVKLARIYWNSAWILVALSVIIFLFYHIFVSVWLNDSQYQLNLIKEENCFSRNQGINLAISKLIQYDEETRNNFQHLVNEIFIFGAIYAGIWICIIAFFKNKYSQVQSFFGN
ncbi:hypothetical protein PPERSA_10093 [Pseudocohnilembus persalinus]|uniref:Transmembrane protein n=1 Tax=Pseudocohnilembus persalinus TaxID=266149 RepID=A0A0V0QK46_PSEPJ|nr:hypothetical protein PPERSA_10093 [Pseudocohnilembus persalinus]|eukprot:KRX02476.1 hypothetical protein PPERSA_10093 [Pseudocohnilembus persalinus]